MKTMKQKQERASQVGAGNIEPFLVARWLDASLKRCFNAPETRRRERNQFGHVANEPVRGILRRYDRSARQWGSPRISTACMTNIDQMGGATMCTLSSSHLQERGEIDKKTRIASAEVTARLGRKLGRSGFDLEYTPVPHL